MIGIYVIICKINKKMYIGSSMNLDKRIKRHKSDLKGNRHDNKYLQNDWNLFGEDCFEFKVVKNYDEIDRKSLEKIEYNYIEKNDNLYNVLGKLVDKNYYKDKWRKAKLKQ